MEADDEDAEDDQRDGTDANTARHVVEEDGRAERHEYRCGPPGDRIHDGEIASVVSGHKRGDVAGMDDGRCDHERPRPERHTKHQNDRQ